MKSSKFAFSALTVLLATGCGRRPVGVGDGSTGGTDTETDIGPTETGDTDDPPDKLDVLGPDDPCNGADPGEPCIADDGCVTENPCGGEPCPLECIGGKWTALCEPCNGDCPAELPLDGDPCDSGEVGCNFDRCENDNEFFTAMCEGGKWKIDAVLCEGPAGCAFGGEDYYEPCPENTVCVEDTSCTWFEDICQDNPCTDQPFSCGCAGQLCQDQDCLWAAGGWVLCGDADAYPDVLTNKVDGARNLVLHDEHVYWYARAGIGSATESVSRVPKAGGSLESVALPGGGEWLAANSTDLFVTSYDESEVWGIPIFDAEVETVTDQLIEPRRVLADDDHVYLHSGDYPDKLLWRVPLEGGQAVLLASESAIAAITQDETHLYWAEDGGDWRIRRVPKNGGAVEDLALDEFAANDIDVDDTHLYWVKQNDTIRRMPKGGGAPETIQSTSDKPKRLAVDDTHVYWSYWGDAGGIERAPKAGGAAELLVAQQPEPQALELDDSRLFWFTRHCGQLLSLPK